MANLNKVMLIGNLTADPVLRHAGTGTAVTDLRLAINRVYTTKDGERREEVCYVDVTVWDRMAENCCKFLKKGRPVFVEGSLKYETWDTPSGEKRSKHKVQAEMVQFLGSPDGPGGGGGSSSRQADPTEEYGPPPVRESRRSAPAPAANAAPAASGAPGGNGPGGRPAGNYGYNRPAPPPAPARDESEDDDIPF